MKRQEGGSASKGQLSLADRPTYRVPTATEDAVRHSKFCNRDRNSNGASASGAPPTDPDDAT